jgi:6-pyruvoyltetrahydropterin/6-carboxytetrahydropterin synthase
MYYVSKRLEISAAHFLTLNYVSKCSRIHGHNWIVTVYCRAKELNENGMVVDFTKIKEIVIGQLDHACMNDILPCNPTAENIAHWICQQIPHCYRVEIQESEGNTAAYELD